MGKKYITKSKQRIIPFRKNHHRKLVLIFSLSFLFGMVLFQSQWWYFFSTGKEQVDFQHLTGIYNTEQTEGEFLGRSVHSSAIDTISGTDSSVLGDTTSSKRIEVDLTNQKLFAYEGDTRIYEFPVSTGKWGRTPTGTFQIWYKIIHTRMKGGSKALGTYYDLPNVPFTMFFANSEVPQWRGFGIHGAYWHNNFGHPMSHGCINMRPDDARTLFYWATPIFPSASTRVLRATPENPGTTVIIYGTAPQS